MDRKQLTYVILFVVVVAGVLGMRNYFAPGAVVRRQIFEAMASFKNEKILGVMSKISRSYTDDWGGSYEGLGAQIQSMMESYDALSMDVDINSGQRATNAALANSSAGSSERVARI